MKKVTKEGIALVVSWSYGDMVGATIDLSVYNSIDAQDRVTVFAKLKGHPTHGAPNLSSVRGLIKDAYVAEGTCPEGYYELECIMK